MPESTRRHFIASAAAGVTAPAILTGQQRQRRRPNVIVVITDDQGYGDLSIHGNDKLETLWRSRECNSRSFM